MEHHSDTMASKESVAVSNPLQKLRATCDACNQAKVKCSKNKPSCSRCTSHDIPCVYGISRAGKHRRHSRASKPTPNNPLLSPFQHQFIFENLQPLDIPYDENIFPTGAYEYEHSSTPTTLSSPYIPSARTSGDYSDFSVDNFTEWGTASYTSNPADYSTLEATGMSQLDIYTTTDQNQTDWSSTTMEAIQPVYQTASNNIVNNLSHYNSIDNTPYHSDAATSPPSPPSYLTSPSTVAFPKNFFESCSCYQTIVQGLQILQSVSSPISDVTFDYAMDRNREANTLCTGVLECHCSPQHDRTHVMLLASLIAKSIATTRMIYSFISTPSNRPSRGASFDDCEAEASMIGFGYEQYASDSTLGLKLPITLMELTRAEGIVYQFVQILLQPLRMRKEQLGTSQDPILEDSLRTYESLSLHLQTKLGEIQALVLMNGDGLE